MFEKVIPAIQDSTAFRQYLNREARFLFWAHSREDGPFENFIFSLLPDHDVILVPGNNQATLIVGANFYIFQYPEWLQAFKTKIGREFSGVVAHGSTLLEYLD